MDKEQKGIVVGAPITGTLDSQADELVAMLPELAQDLRLARVTILRYLSNAHDYAYTAGRASRNDLLGQHIKATLGRMREDLDNLEARVK